MYVRDYQAIAADDKYQMCIPGRDRLKTMGLCKVKDRRLWKLGASLFEGSMILNNVDAYLTDEAADEHREQYLHLECIERSLVTIGESID